MSEEKNIAPLTVTLSFPEGFSQSFCDLVGSRASDFISIVSEEFFRDLVTRPKDSSTGLTDNLIIAPRLSISDFDTKLTAALRAFRLELHSS